MSTATADHLADLLAEIALAPGSAEPSPALIVLAAGSLASDALAAAWQDYREAVRLREALATGQRDWRDADPEAADLDDAVLRACARTDEAYRVLAYGPPPAAA